MESAPAGCGCQCLGIASARGLARPAWRDCVWPGGRPGGKNVHEAADGAGLARVGAPDQAGLAAATCCLGEAALPCRGRLFVQQLCDSRGRTDACCLSAGSAQGGSLSSALASCLPGTCLRARRRKNSGAGVCPPAGGSAREQTRATTRHPRAVTVPTVADFGSLAPSQREIQGSAFILSRTRVTSRKVQKLGPSVLASGAPVRGVRVSASVGSAVGKSWTATWHPERRFC